MWLERNLSLRRAVSSNLYFDPPVRLPSRDRAKHSIWSVVTLYIVNLDSDSVWQFTV